MSNLNRAWHVQNLELAWAWVRSNPSSSYKGYFRELYSAYATADGPLLSDLANRLKRRIYKPTDACKIFLPKPSGILRPLSLLSVEDQIVYQALTNIVAERLVRSVGGRYNKEVFAHQYAGRESIWFYRKWSDGYRAFNKAAERAYLGGFQWTASFDLTAFYDSIDHKVLRHFIEKLGLGPEFSNSLTELLSAWTATSTRIYHNHGIPQGPLSSGLIAETVLAYFDSKHPRDSGVRYFRYVDDIRLFARDSHELRGMLVSLDRLSKDVGLFPQSGKIDIHHITDINQELKSLSTPAEAVLLAPELDQKALYRRLVELTPKYVVANQTRFKYLLGRALPSARLTDRLWRIYANQPHYYDSIARYLSRYKKIPDRVGIRLVSEIDRQRLYPAVRAAFIQASTGRLSPKVMRVAARKFKPLWTPRVSQPDLSDALGAWLHHERRFTDRQCEYSIVSTRPDWLRARIQHSVRWSEMSPRRTQRWLNENVRAKSADVAVSAAKLIGTMGVVVNRPTRDIHPLAKAVLKEFGRLKRSAAGVCGIRMGVEEMTGHDIPVGWRKLFGRDYKHAEAQIVECKGYFKTSPSSWVNSADVFVDWLLAALFRRDASLGTYSMGNVGGYMSHGALKTKYPAVFKLLNAVHGKRYESNLSHATVRKTGRPTGRIKFSWLRNGASLLRAAAEELAVAWPAK